MRSKFWSGFFFVAVLSAFILPSPSMAAVRIELKNGGTIIADECREADGKLLCYKMGGTFEIEKHDVASMKKIAATEDIEEQEASPSVQPGTTVEPAKPNGNAGAENTAAETQKRLEQITERKRALLPEREKLIKEREHLQEEVKKAPDWMTTDRYNDLKKKSADIDERIKSFNDEVKKLNQEEKTIRDSLKTAVPKAP